VAAPGARTKSCSVKRTKPLSGPLFKMFAATAATVRLILFAGLTVWAMTFGNIAHARTGDSDRPAFATCTGTAKTYDIGAPSKIDDTNTIQSAIDQAILDVQSGKANGATIRFQVGATYHLKGRRDNFDAIVLKTKNIEKLAIGCITIDGRGATLSLAPTTNAFYVYGCINCTIENIRIQADPTPLVEGSLISANTAGNGSIEMQVEHGTATPVPPNYARAVAVGNYAAISIFHSRDSVGFPRHLSYAEQPPFLSIDSISIPSTGKLEINYAGMRSGARVRQTPAILSRLAPGATVVTAVDPVLDAEKNATLTAVDASAETLAARTRQPALTARFFTGGRLPAFLVESCNSFSLRNVTISGVGGAGLFLTGNRGPLILDAISIIPRTPDGLLSIGSDGIDAHNNEYGPTLRNSRIEYTADDALNLVSFPFWAQSASGNSAVLSMDPRLAAAPVVAGDRFLVLDTLSGRRLGEFTVKEVSSVFDREAGTQYRVAFDRALPEIRAAGGESPTTFLNLNMLNHNAVVENNLFMGGQRNGILMTSSATIARNTFIGLGLHAVHYLGLLRPNPGLFQPRGIWGDFGPVSLINNTVVDTMLGLLQQGGGRYDSGFHPTFDGLTVHDNTVLGPRQRIAEIMPDFNAPVLADHNQVVVGDTDALPADQARQRLNTAQSGPLRFETKHLSDDALWKAKCQATATWHLC
jgi:hypothetical protein